MKFNNIFLVSAIVSLSVALSSCYESALEYEGDVNSINSDDGTGSDEGFLASPDLAVGFLRTAQLRVIDAKEHPYQYQYTLVYCRETSENRMEAKAPKGAIFNVSAERITGTAC